MGRNGKTEEGKQSRTMSEANRFVGRSRSYFQSIKHYSPEMIEILARHGSGDLGKGYFEIRDYLNEELYRIGVFTEALVEKRLLSTFSKDLHRRKIYRNEKAFATTYKKFIFSSRERITVKAIRRVERLSGRIGEILSRLGIQYRGVDEFTIYESLLSRSRSDIESAIHAD